MEQPFEGKATVNETYDGMEISIPTKKQWSAILFLCVWLAGWVFGLRMVSSVAIDQAQPANTSTFTWIWLVGWTIGGLIAIRTVIWSVFGKEIITFHNGQITIARKGLIPSFTKTYNLNEAKDFRIGQLPPSGLDVWGNERRTMDMSTNTGHIWFDYGMKTIKFGAGIDEAEAKHLVQRMKDKRLIGDKMQTAYKTYA